MLCYVERIRMPPKNAQQKQGVKKGQAGRRVVGGALEQGISNIHLVQKIRLQFLRLHRVCGRNVGKSLPLALCMFSRQLVDQKPIRDVRLVIDHCAGSRLIRYAKLKPNAIWEQKWRPLSIRRSSEEDGSTE